MRSTTRIRTCADGMSDSITFFVIELRKKVGVKF